MTDTVSLNISIKGPDLSHWIDDIAKSQIPFAMSQAMNKLGGMIGAQLVQISGQQFNIRAAWSRRYRRGSISAGENFITDAAPYFSTQVSKKMPIAQMKVKVATASWQIAQQSDDGPSARTPEYISLQSDKGNKVDYIAVPILQNVKYGTNGKLRPNAQHLLNNAIKNRVFIINTNGSKLLCQRHGSGPNDYRALYVLIPAVNVNPKFNFNQTVSDTVNRLFEKLFDEAMTKAVATARTP